MDQLAERQHGLITRAQAIEAGLSPAAIRHRLESGRWHLVRGGVYRLPGSPRTWHQRLLAVVLAAGSGAVASHSSAAALFGVPGFPSGRRPEISTPRDRRVRHPDAAVHRSLWLPDSHVAIVEGIPTTRVARTLVDLAGAVLPGRLERALDNSLSMGIVTLASLATVTHELTRPGRPGIAIMRRLLADRGAGYVAPASELEARFLALVRAAGLPEPVRQCDVGDEHDWLGRSDYGYLAERVLIELDSRRHHLSELDFQRDRERDNRRIAAGWRPLRFTWHDITARPKEVIAILRATGVGSRGQGDAA